MSRISTFSHEERPEYQRENIDIAIKIVLGIMSNLGVDNSGYNPNNIRYVDSKGNFGGRNTFDGVTKIDIYHGFNTKVHIHEMLHAHSRSATDLTEGVLYRCGYSSSFTNSTESNNHNNGFNEGLTQLITLYGIRENFDEIRALREKFRSLMEDHQYQAKTSGDRRYSTFSHGCTNTGWYRSYFREMRLVNSIVDLVSYERLKKGGEIEDHKNDIYTDLVIGYFTGDFKILRSILKEADPSGLVKKHIEVIQPGDILGKIITDDIRKHIKDIFDPQYRMSPIPRKLT